MLPPSPTSWVDLHLYKSKWTLAQPSPTAELFQQDTMLSAVSRASVLYGHSDICQSTRESQRQKGCVPGSCPGWAQVYPSAQLLSKSGAHPTQPLWCCMCSGLILQMRKPRASIGPALLLAQQAKSLPQAVQWLTTGDYRSLDSCVSIFSSVL